jgi:hypothetical protein
MSACSQDSGTASEENDSPGSTNKELRAGLLAVFELFNKIAVAFRKGMAICIIFSVWLYRCPPLPHITPAVNFQGRINRTTVHHWPEAFISSKENGCLHFFTYKKAKLCLCLTKHYAMKTYGEWM